LPDPAGLPGPAGRGVAVVTGAGSGIGRVSAAALAADGWHVVVTGRRVDAITETCDRIEAAGGSARPVPTDVSDEASVAALFASVEDNEGRIDLLFNNAGTGMAAHSIDEVPVAEWSRVVATNLTGTFLCTRAAFALMRAQDPQGGRIINNGSISAAVPRPLAVAYTATKHAVTGLTKSTSLEGRPYGIACGQIDIGNAATEMTERMTAGVPQADGSQRVEPRMDAADVARAVVYMASLPLSANVHYLTVMATTMPFVGRG